MIRWIEIDKITGLDLTRKFGEILRFNLRARQEFRGTTKAFSVEDARLSVAADRHIKFAAAVHTIETVEASLVQIDESRSGLCPIMGSLTPNRHIVIFTLSLLVHLEPFDYLIEVIAHRNKRLDKLNIVVPQNRSLRFH